ncbi:hypothetical protein MMC26_001587 [Xylographa opegraphella]|nr:hypothetical protein [Xylographa opegraphella]
MNALYERLSETDIRLLTVSVHEGAVASLELHTYPRSAAPEYDAVSYAWGDDASTTSVMCNGAPLAIRTSLFTALPFIHGSRPEPRTRPLWIDAVCLNQRDRREKAIHVSCMGEVYENATRTLVWLGEADDSSDLAMDNMESLTQKLLAVKDPNSLTVRQRLANYGLPPPDDPKWEALKSLQQRPWLFRLWTLQEIVLAKDAVLLCGCKSTSWDAVVALHRAAIQAELHIMVKADAERETPYKQAQIFITHVDFLRQHRGILTLCELLTLSVDRGYSVPVDRVWALLGLLNKNYQQHIRNARLVDYSDAAIAHYHETFLRITTFHIQRDPVLAMRIIEDNLRTARHPSLPSWCPDWHTDRGDMPLSRWPEARAGIPGGHSRRLEAYMRVTADSPSPSSSSSLELCGLEVDIVERVTASPGARMLDLDSYPWLSECLRIIHSTPFVPHGVYPATATGLIPASPTAAVDGSPIHPRRQKYTRAEELLKYVLYPPGTMLVSSPRTILRCNGRTFFATRAGRLGIGPAGLRADDRLCAMYGARTLWALRPLEGAVERCPGARESAFELLGSAYTPSLLKGEAWAGKSCEAMRRFTLR